MNSLVFLIVVFFLLIIALKFFKSLASFFVGKSVKIKVETLPYTKKRSIFSPAERSFYGVLKEIIGDNADVFAKIRVADVVSIKRGLEKSKWQSAFNRISRKHFDFVICDKSSLSVLCVIELNDSSHRKEERQQRDEFLRLVCESAGIPLVEVRAKQSYSREEITSVLVPYVDFSQSRNRQVETNNGSKVCPKCGAVLVIKVAKKGKNAGKKFWACSNYPKCRYIEPIDS